MRQQAVQNPGKRYVQHRDPIGLPRQAESAQQNQPISKTGFIRDKHQNKHLSSPFTSRINRPSIP
ncbi:hypothetical protein BRW84_07510 [Oxalobacter formigenes OXCC13]|nr:hypothetical protein BRW84_07510 [Oxalobacter formigenes OXCC13]